MKIVIVDDDLKIRDDLAERITALSPEYEVAGLASDGSEGMDMILREQPDLVITAIGLPKMDGLGMLTALRSRKQNFRAIVVTGHTEFDYIQRAVCLGIENYILKPVNPDDLTETLDRIYREFTQDEETDKALSRFLTLEQIIRSLILAELPVDDDLKVLLKDQYRMNADEPLGLIGIWLGSHFEEERERVVQIVESYSGKAPDYGHVTIPSYNYRAILVVAYNVNDPEKLYRRSVKTITSVIRRNLKHVPVLTWAVCDAINDLPEEFEKSIEARKWNLCLPECTLIKVDETDSYDTVRITFPLQKEEDLREVVAERNLSVYHRMIKGLESECMNATHDPDEIREISVRFCLAILAEAQAIGRVYPHISRQEVVGRLDKAITWEDIEEVFEKVYNSVTTDNDTGGDFSPLIRRALNLIEESYAQGLTLEELARKLGVSQEYLSAQFRKETGSTFKETVRRCQITRVKELLLQSDLRLNQIADLAGYSDPKYMSKVFKEEVGMLPSEFRSLNR